MTALIVGLVGLVVGSVLQAATGWISDSRTAKREHSQWRRDKRYEAFTEFVDALYARTSAIGQSPVDVSKAFNQYQKALVRAYACATDVERINIAGINQELTNAFTLGDLIERAEKSAAIYGKSITYFASLIAQRVPPSDKDEATGTRLTVDLKHLPAGP